MSERADAGARVAPADDASYRAAFESASAAMAMADRTGRFVAVNGALCRMLGYRREELLALSFRELTHPDELADNTRLFAQLWAGEIPGFTLDKRYLARDGRTIPCRLHLELARDGTGRALHTVATVEDLRALTRSTEELRIRQALQRVAGQLARVGGWSLELPGREVTWSDEVFRILDAPAGAAPTMSVGLERYAAADRERVTAALEACAVEGAAFDLDAGITTFAGREIRVRVLAEPERDTDGTIRRVVGALQDVTELTEATERATAVAHQLTEALTSMSDAFFLIDRDWRFRYLNPEAERLLQRPASELLGRVIWDEFPEAVDSEFHDAYLQAVATDEHRGLREAYFQPLDTWFDVDAYPSAQGLAVYFRDVTQQRRIEQQLVQSQRMESLGTLAGGIAHDLNNVLTPILLSTRLLAEDVDGEGRDELIETIELSARRGADMVRQVLSFARGIDGDRVPLDLAVVVRDVHRIAAETFPRSVRLRVSLEPGLPPVEGDATQLHQVLMNLLVNARDALSRGGSVRLRAATVEAQDAGGVPDVGARQVLVEVEDDGVGMSGEVLRRAFDPFFSTKPPGEGTGLGLSTALTIVRSHGGHLRAYSEPGRGTTVRMSLPALTEEAVDGASIEPGDGAAPDGEDELVLVADDEVQVLALTRRTLEAHGYRVRTAADGAEAVALFAEDPAAFDLVVTDVTMPVMDGLATVHALQHLRPDIPVVAASGLHADGDVVRMEALGVRVFLRKPFSSGALLRAVRDVLDG